MSILTLTEKIEAQIVDNSIILSASNWKNTALDNFLVGLFPSTLKLKQVSLEKFSDNCILAGGIDIAEISAKVKANFSIIDDQVSLLLEFSNFSSPFSLSNWLPDFPKSMLGGFLWDHQDFSISIKSNPVQVLTQEDINSYCETLFEDTPASFSGYPISITGRPAASEKYAHSFFSFWGVEQIKLEGFVAKVLGASFSILEFTGSLNTDLLRLATGEESDNPTELDYQFQFITVGQTTIGEPQGALGILRIRTTLDGMLSYADIADFAHVNLSFILRSKEKRGSDIAKILDLIPGVNLKDLMSADFPFQNQLDLDHLVLGINRASRQLTNIELQAYLSENTEWDIIPNQIRLSEFSADLIISNPLNNAYRSTSFWLYADATYQEKLFQAGVDLSSLNFSLHLQENQVFDLSSIFETIITEISIPRPPSLLCHQLSLRGGPNGITQFRGSIVREWEISSGFLLSALSCNIETKQTVYFSGALSLGHTNSFRFFVESERQINQADSGWLFHGSSDIDQIINLSDFIEELTAIYSLPISLPSLIKDAKLNYVDISYHTHTKDLSFSASSIIHINQQPIAGVINFEIQHNEAQKATYTFSAQLQLDIGYEERISFDLIFDQADGNTLVLAALQPETEGIYLSMADLINGLLGTQLPDLFDLEIKASVLAFRHTESVDKAGISVQIGKDPSFLQLSKEEQFSSLNHSLNGSDFLLIADIYEDLSLQDFSSQLFYNLQEVPLPLELPFSPELIPNIALEQFSLQFSPSTNCYAIRLQADQASRDLFFALWQDKQGTIIDYYFQVQPGPAIALQGLPFIGSKIPPDPVLTLEELQLRLSSSNGGQKVKTELNKGLFSNTTGLEQPAAGQALQTWSGEEAAGIFLAGYLRLGDHRYPLQVPLQIEYLAPPTETETIDDQFEEEAIPDSQVRKSSIFWFEVNKQLGIIKLSRIGLQYRDKKAWLYVDASMMAGPVVLSTLGLGVGSPLDDFKPAFDLQGLGLSFSNGFMGIGGALLRENEHNYQGAAFLKTNDLVISALGSYQELANQSSSLFLYALLNKPIGGPPFFFVTGLSLGFGINQQLRQIRLSEVANFPLVRQAISKSLINFQPPDLSDLVRKAGELQSFQYAQHNAAYLALGIKFTSFKLVDSFALLISRLEQPFVLDIIGMSELRIPAREADSIASVPPLALVRMPFTARYNPVEGQIRVRAKLSPDSYIFTGACRLRGEFAYYAWFNGPKAGDFVVSLGGYHPAFNLALRPHYPQVPRLDFKWQITPNLQMSGKAYLALTPDYLMAGLDLRTTFRLGPLEVYFGFVADFLIRWQPFRYEAKIRVMVAFALGIRVRIKAGLFSFTISVTLRASAGADLLLWGPDIGGKIGVSVGFAKIDIGFGQNRPDPVPNLNWGQFSKAFLPKIKNHVLRLAPVDGLIKILNQSTDQEIWLMNPREFTLIVESIIPIKKSQGLSFAVAPSYKSFGIAPMGISDESNSQLIIEINRASDFSLRPIYKLLPRAIWGSSPRPSLNSSASPTIETLVGFQIVPAKNPIPGSTREIDKKPLLFDLENAEKQLNWQVAPKLNYLDSYDLEEKDLKNEATLQLLVELGFNSKDQLDSSHFSTNSNFDYASQVVSLN